MILLISASQVAEIPGLSHCVWLSLVFNAKISLFLSFFFFQYTQVDHFFSLASEI
jgi:hypothetical protein